MRVIYLMIACFLVVQPAFAQEAVSRLVAEKKAVPSTNSNENCPFVETASINISFNSMETDLSKISTIMAEKTAQVEALSKEAGLTKFSLQSSNYSINSNAGNCNATTGQFQFYGNVSFTVEPADKAAAFLAAVAEKGLTANMSMNSYRQCQ